MTLKLFYDPLLMKIGGGSGYAGRWKGVKPESGIRSAIISCPKCGRLASLTQHTIADDGKVSPSFVCPSKVPPCDFHDHLTLKDWGPYKRRQ